MIKRLSAAVALLLFGVSANAAITFDNCGTAVNQQDSSTGAEVGLSTYTAGDMLVAFSMVSNAGAAALQNPQNVRVNETGWTEHVNFTNLGGFDKALDVSYDEAASQSGNQTVDSSDTTTADYDWQAIFCTFDGVDTTVTFDVAATTYATTDTTSPDPASITTVTDGALVCVVGASVGGTVSNITPPSGYTERVEQISSAEYLYVACKEVATAGAEDPGTLGGYDTTTDHAFVTVALRPAATGPTFSSGPTLNSCNDTTCTFDVTPSENVTVYGATYPPAATAPADCDAVQTGTGAIDTSSKAITGADTLVLDADLPRQDYYFCLENGSAEQSDVAEPTGTNPVDRALTGYNDYVLTTLSGTSWFAQPVDTAGDTTLDSNVITGLSDTSDIPVGGRISASAGFADSVLHVQAKTASTITVDQDATSNQTNITVSGVIDGGGNWLFPTALAAGDILEAQNTSDIGGTVTCAVDFDCTYTPDSGEENDLAAILNNFEDVSDATDGLFASPTNPVTVYINNEAPVCDFEDIAGQAYYGAVSIDLSARCTHPSLTTAFETRSGDSYHTGLSLSGATISGTVNTEDESGVTVQIWACADDLCELKTWVSYYVDTWTLTDCVGSTLETCLSDIVTDAPWRADDNNPYALPGCNPSGTVASQSPAASTEVAPYAEVTLTMSDGLTCALSGCNINAPIKNPILEAVREPVCS